MGKDYDDFTARMTSFDLVLDRTGEAAVHSSEPTFDEVLAHYGVKGMRWGVRKRDRSASSGPTDIEVKVAPGKRIKTKGGKGHAPAEDAVKSAVLRQKAKASTLDSLSNEELQALTKRLQLEANYLKLVDGPTTKKGKSFIDTLLDDEMEAVKKGNVGPTAATINGVKKILDFSSLEKVDL